MLLGVPAPSIVKGQHVDKECPAVGVCPLDKVPNLLMDRFACRQRHALVGDLLRDHVLEQVLQFRLGLIHGNQIQSTEAIQMFLDLPW